MTDKTTEVCEACGEPATRHDACGIPLCEEDYWHLVEHWNLEKQQMASDQATPRITELSGEQIMLAMAWYGQHTAHVERMIAVVGPSYPPTGDDCSRPELWKDSHWRWLRDNAQ